MLLHKAKRTGLLREWFTGITCLATAGRDLLEGFRSSLIENSIETTENASSEPALFLTGLFRFWNYLLCTCSLVFYSVTERKRPRQFKEKFMSSIYCAFILCAFLANYIHLYEVQWLIGLSWSLQFVIRICISCLNKVSPLIFSAGHENFQINADPCSRQGRRQMVTACLVYIRVVIG